MGMDAVPVSVVIPCRNEKQFIAGCVQSVFSSNYAGGLEVLVVDGISDDGTRDLLEEMCKSEPKLRVLDNPRRDTASALNIGFEASSGEVVLILGAHSELSRDYIDITVSRLLSESDIGCVGGRMIPEVEGTDLRVSIGDVQKSLFGVGNSFYKIPGENVREVDTVAYGSYRKEATLKAGFFDVALTRNQDIEYNYRLRKVGYRIILDPKAIVYYHPRVTLGSFCKQNYGNGFWNIETWKRMPGSLSWRHFVPLAFVLALCVCVIGSFWASAFRWLLALVVGPYLLLDLAETIKVVWQRRRAGAVVTFLVFPMLHLSYGIGSLSGILSQLTASRRKNAAAETT